MNGLAFHARHVVRLDQTVGLAVARQPPATCNAMRATCDLQRRASRSKCWLAWVMKRLLGVGWVK